ncbi:MAG TPA: pyridoxamine 5'-phosphate oxidase family protein [Candidatus Sulfotelmatobacter sp.]|nr:pyridoxamine 5'-phosphate oxidase family protein [Candidatus Sulfotelmatobacter sp.]
MTEDSHHPALQLVQKQRTLVLAIADPAPWSAPVCYLYSHGHFYFFSHPESRHIRGAASQRLCAASLYRESDNWQDLEGLQMEGTVQHIHTGKAAFDVLPAYLAKFPTVKHSFLPPGSALNLTSFCKLVHAELYAFTPTLVFYFNNREGFASRRDITAIFHSSP